MLFFGHEQTGLRFTGKVLTVSLLRSEQHFEERGDLEKWVESYISIELEKFLLPLVGNIAAATGALVPVTEQSMMTAIQRVLPMRRNII